MRLFASIGFGLGMTICSVVSSFFTGLTSQIATPFAKPQDSLPAGSLCYFSQLLEFCVLHWEYCSALALGQDVYQDTVYTAIAVHTTAFDCTLVGKHVCSREGVLGSNPTTPNFLPNAFAARWRLFEECPIEGTSFTVRYTVFQGYLRCDRLL